MAKGTDQVVPDKLAAEAVVTSEETAPQVERNFEALCDALNGLWKERNRPQKEWYVEGDKAFTLISPHSVSRYSMRPRSGGGLNWGDGKYVLDSGFKSGAKVAQWRLGADTGRVAFEWLYLGPGAMPVPQGSRAVSSKEPAEIKKRETRMKWAVKASEEEVKGQDPPPQPKSGMKWVVKEAKEEEEEEEDDRQAKDELSEKAGQQQKPEVAHVEVGVKGKSKGKCKNVDGKKGRRASDGGKGKGKEEGKGGKGRSQAKGTGRGTSRSAKGLASWAQPSHLELRIDKSDGHAYPWEWFETVYGGACGAQAAKDYWNQCAVVKRPPAGVSPWAAMSGRAHPAEKRTDYTDGQAYTFQEFCNFYSNVFTLAAIENYWWACMTSEEWD
uniref:Uncharacterized protein n=1 Tax=Noctiluca scintillans TaxID=2966 RepID=A0A7S1ACV0_NOCSC|mmetsp:Transcript_41221/g.109078  ORF Transcript_41221/g.109078 Transcript_41221/m.109078 type:complete len:384 (+) Transcript_41221:87-1238(+)|eukprot:CAMPEP_0194499164 /NCGR_PEP_ID=MMETSP0253-20130528/15559_1 /TAXON_ID=2966 /ORGANISM="Noctiluca scintillans" /LENGTH=383 /DNA_ID=CAMNT_0039340893 /DNA_START=52 /DNA_END=1203 /DNA_ORIENTATION=-